MNEADPALIVVHRVGQRVPLYRVPVLIDGRKAGSVGPGRSIEFPVDPGVHIVEVKEFKGLGYSQPLRLEVAPGSRTALSIARRPWSFLKSFAPIGIFIIVANLLTSLLRDAGLSDLGLVGLFGVVLVSSCLMFASIRIPPLLVKDFWALYILEPMSGPVAGAPSPAAR